MSISGCAIASTSVSRERLLVVPGQRVAHRFLASNAGAELGLEHAPRRFAGPEPVDLDLAGETTERGVDRLFELRLVDLDGQLDLVALEGFSDCLHKRSSVPAG